MKLIYDLVRPNAKAPTKKYPEDAGWDVFACSDYVVNPGMRRLIPTGLAMKLEPTAEQRAFAENLGVSWYLRAADKSGLADSLGIHVLGGVIDRQYRGELNIIVINLGFWAADGTLVHSPWTVRAGEKICQVIPSLIWDVRLAKEGQVANETTDRGANGFGSTGNT